MSDEYYNAMQEIQRLHNVTAQLRAENTAMREDAERYRWLKAFCMYRTPDGESYRLSFEWLRGNGIDDVIDAARGEG